MLNTLKTNKDVKVITEFWPFGLQKAGSSALEMINFVTDLGFQVYLLSEEPTRLLTKENSSELKNNEESYYNVFLTRKPLNS
jgi:hypothetical protein